MADDLDTVHGGLIDAELAALGLMAQDVLDLSVNVSPFGPLPEVLAAVRAAPLERYPDPTAHTARARIAPWLDVSPDELVLAHGAAELLWLLARELAAGEEVLVVAPAFSEIRRAALAAGARVIEIRHVRDGLAPTPAAIAAAVRTHRPALAYVATPANPTGQVTPLDALAELAAGAPGTWIVVDESFLSVSDDHAAAATPLPANVLRLRSLTKDHALPGLRVGYLLAPPALASRLEAARPPWSVSAPAQAAAVAALDPARRPLLARRRERWLAARDALARALRDEGLSPWSSAAPYLYVPVAVHAGVLRGRLLARHRVLVRDTTSFGLPGAIRVCGVPGVDAGVAAAIAEEIHQCPPVA